MAKVDLKGFQSLMALDWNGPARAASLDSLFDRTRAETQQAIDWYFPKRSWRKRCSQATRSGAIVFFTLAGLQPLIAAIPKEGHAVPEWMPEHPIWASLFLALAVALLGFDRYSGLSKGWIRYVTTGLKLKQMLNGFVFASEQDRVSWAGTTPTDDQLRASLTRCAAFIQQVDEVVRDETKAWAEDFIDTMQQLGAAVKAGQASTEAGSIQLTVSNGDMADGSWIISIDGARVGEPKTGVTASLTDLAPRAHRVVVEGKIQGRVARAEQTVVVSPGAVTPATVDLR